MHRIVRQKTDHNDFEGALTFVSEPKLGFEKIEFENFKLDFHPLGVIA